MMHNRISLTIFGCLFLAVSFAQPRSENRQRTPEENQFYDRIDAVIRKAMPATPPANWEKLSETEDNTHILPAWDAPKNKGPYYYSFEKSYTLSNNVLQRSLDSLSQQIVDNPGNAEAISKKMEAFTAASSCNIKVDVNTGHTALSYCSGRISYPKIKGATQAVRVETGSLATDDCRATTQVLIGQFSPLKAYPYDNSNGGTISAESKFSHTQPFSIHSIVVTVIASPQVADTILAGMDIMSLSKLVQP